MAPVESIGIGISLTTGYGTIALRYNDGSYQNIGKVDGDPSYLETMRHLSLISSTHTCPPYGSLENLWEDFPRECWRSIRKRLGLAASPDVAALSKVIKDLYNAALPHLPTSNPISSVVVTYPALIALYYEDIDDAVEHVKLTRLHGQHLHQPRELVAACAGYGFGLCKSYQDYKACDSEGLQLPAASYLLVEYTKKSLALHAEDKRQAYELGSKFFFSAACFGLGSDQPDAGAPSYNERVRYEILSLLRERYKDSEPPKMIRVIVTGESGNSVAFQHLIKAATEEYIPVVEMLTSHPEYIAAQGAAELAWRALKVKH